MLPHGKCVTIFGGNLSKGCLIKITTKMSKNSANDNYIKNKKKKNANNNALSIEYLSSI